MNFKLKKHWKAITAVLTATVCSFATTTAIMAALPDLTPYEHPVDLVEGTVYDTGAALDITKANSFVGDYYDCNELNNGPYITYLNFTFQIKPEQGDSLVKSNISGEVKYNDISSDGHTDKLVATNCVEIKNRIIPQNQPTYKLPFTDGTQNDLLVAKILNDNFISFNDGLNDSYTGIYSAVDSATYTLDARTTNGKKIVGWKCVTVDDTDAFKANSDVPMRRMNYTFEAVWGYVNRVSFDANGGTF